MTTAQVIIAIFIVIAVTALLGVILIRRKMAAAGKRWLDLLKSHPGFSSNNGERYADMRFQYADPQGENLQTLKERYHLDAVAGDGSEIQRIVNLMKWVNRLTWHHPRPRIAGPYNALHLISLAKGYRKGINCWMFAIILNEVYLSMGFASRMVHLKPHSKDAKESHFVTAIYSQDLGKWIFMDPDFGGYFKDEEGNILGIPEIRRRLISGAPLVVNQDVRGFTKILGRGSYPWYLSKNIFRYTCAQRSEFNHETERKDRIYYELIPDGYREELLLESEITKRGSRIFYTNDEVLFWQNP